MKVFKNKRLLLVAGLMVGLVTLFSHSLRVEVPTKIEKKTTEQSSSEESNVVIITPSDAVTVNFFTLQVDGFIELTHAFQQVKKVCKVVPSFQKRSTTFFQTLFRFIISPNAP
jgi:hypothetical protein